MKRFATFILAFAVITSPFLLPPCHSYAEKNLSGSATFANPTLSPLREGVVFFLPDNTDEAIQQLGLIRAQGFNLIEFASWAWTLPKEGSPFQQSVSAVLDWCDQHDMAFFLMQNIQYNDEGEGGGLDDQVQNPEKAFPLITDWAKELQSHRCVKGVILGNEVGPTLGDPKKSPVIWSQFRAWLKDRYGSVANLNSHWGSEYVSFDDVVEPKSGSPGWLDYDQYANLRFAAFYNTIVEKALKPVLGNLFYGNKTNLDPFLHRACKSMTMCCWDDLNSQYPLWQIKLAADTTGKPLFNSELHLYEDNYNYGASVSHSRYRYFMSALLGEYTTASFAWGQWNKPETRKVADATPGILSDLKKTQGACRAIARAYQTSDLMILVNRRTYEDEMAGVGGKTLENIYAQMGALGSPWRYLLETDIRKVRSGVLVIPSKYISERDAMAISSLPAKVSVFYLNGFPIGDEYGLPLHTDAINSLRKRGRLLTMDRLVSVLEPYSSPPKAYQKVGNVSYLGWSASRGFFAYPVSYCLAQVFRVRTRNGWLIAVVNNSDKSVSVPPPWSKREKAMDLQTRSIKFGDNRLLLLGPFSIHLFKVTKR